ncbi:TPA: hypothetical protein N0F65_008621 [Lagenidium giganteum]|uniref:B30.2/SPRY domain-containing protein n=1 Tax=Lagenidium giganteum TaxID=4803 RepID=A0AAV2Z395_9STRA|nr:TPA: hypothetical protein N0F65_008621 [Lagenidium giganteum]
MEEATRSRLTIANASRLHLVSRGDSVTTELLHESISVEEALAEIRAQTEAEALERQSIRREEVDQDVGGANAAGGGAVESARELDWAVDDGWIPKPARLHSGKTRYCAVCFAPLQYTTMLHWDEFLQSEEYLALLQENLLDDCFISSLICGDNSGGDLPTEHRMHKNRKLKCRQSVHDYMNMISAGVVDQWGKEKTSVRTLEEMLIYGLPTPIYTHVLERRLAVISHSTKLACSLMKETRASKKSRIAAVPQTHVELHHLAIHTLSALLQSFDYDSPHALQSFEEMSRLLMCFPTLSLFSFWSPPPKQPEKPLVLKKEMVEASSSAVTPRAHPAEFAIDGSDSTFWQSTARPGTVFYTIRSPQLPFVSSIAIRWHFKCHPQTVSVEFKRRGKEDFQKLNEVHVGPAPPQYFVTQFPNDCTEVRLAMSGMPATNRNATYAIEQLKLNVPSSKSMFIEPSETLTDVSKWLLGALGHSNEDVVIEAVATLKSWSLATASLSSVLLFVNMLLKLKKTAPVLDQPGVGQYALDQSKLLSESVHTFFLEEKNRRHRFDGKKKTNESRKIRAFFEPAVCSAGVTIEEGGTTVRTRETSYQYAAVNAGISSGKASWKFRLDNDTVDDEMTCFGAAILPVTVSGYDSSPSLWMLRGYNGNLYARGHKLSRSIGKVHPGDTVEINVDMTEGTLAYKINDTEHGVVFTDLLGHEVYPAVSFYGSGKVITLLGVHKWDDSTSGSTVVDPVYLSSLKEYHFSVGYGLFSKGNTLGYAQDDGFRGSASLANSAIHIGGEPKQRCLSTHPPSRGDAVVLYDLAEAYDRVTGAVAINGDVRTETLQQRGVIVSFSIIGDGKVLWQSKPLYTGDKDHFEGQIGFQFEATSSFSIVALGRSVNPAKNAGRLVRQHTIRLWEEATQTLVAQATVSGSSRKDSLGYVFEPLSTPAKVTQGKLYRLTTQEFANGGDPWYKKENLPDEEYDSSYIRILRDCYASGSSGFPNSQNLTGAAYGVPTFLVEGENPFDSLSSCSPPDGSVSLKFNTKRKLSSVSVSHSGTTANVIGDTGTWRNCFLQTALVQGSHSIDFIVKSVRAGGVISGHVCIGIEWSGCVGADRSDGQLQDPLESFLGESLCSIGWMPSIGALWVQGKRVSYGVKTAVVSGDVLTMAIDFDQQTIAFSHNGKRVGTAVTTRPGIPAAVSLNSLPTAVIPGVSIFGSQDVVQVRPSGIAKSTLTIHWLLDLHNALASLSARVASTLVCGHPIDCIEEELLPWLQSPLLSGGILNAGHGSNDRGELSDWHLCLQQDYQKYPSKSGLLSLLPDMGAPENKTQKSTKKLTSDIDEATKIQDKEFIESFTKDMSDSGPVQLILRWLEKSSPDRSFLSRLGKFPRCERLMCAALIKHAPVHVIHETQAILSGAAVHDLEAFLESVNLAPSEDLVQVWKRVITFRHWLIKTRQEYRARASDDVVQDSNAVYSSTVKHEGIINNDNPSVLAAFMELEEKFSVPKTFEVLLEHVCQRAEFLCALEPPSEDRDRLGADSQTALSNLAEKWSSQNTPPALQPMLERWRTLKESDSSKWSGMVNVLRAQHRWRTRRSSITSVPEDVGDSEVDSPSQPPEYKSTFTATMKACDLYIRNGIGAPPEILQTLLERRQKRSESRIFGLEAMKCIMSMLSYDSARHNAIIFLRPSLRGFTDDEKESRDQNDGQVISESFRATVRHHYLKGLEGCNRFTVDHVEKAFWDLYAFLASLLIGNNGDALDSQLRQALICAWSIDFEPRDHPHLLKSGIISALHNEFSIESVMKDSAADEEVIHAMNPNSAKRSLAYTNVNWYPLSEEYVQQSVLHSGHVTKRDILRLLFQAPPCAYTQNWWTEHGLTVTEGSSLSPISKHTASSMALLYADMLKRLQMKLGSNWEKPLGRKALQFGMSGSSSNHNSTQPKPEDVSFIETPSLGEFVDFTIEMWVYPVELGGYRALRCDNGLGVGSVYLELMDRNLHFAVNGNSPRELLFKQCHFHTHAWTHVAVVYNKSSKSVKVVLNGRLAEEKFFDMVQPTVHLRTARMGCWLNTSKIESPPTTNTLIQRIFKGSIAEVRVWRVARLINHIRRDRSRSIPLQSGEEVSQPSKHLAALWHLNEGEGVCGYNHVSSTAKPWKEDIESSTSDLNSKISSCHWATMNVPVVSNASIDAMDDHAWQRFLRGLVGFQRRMRYLHRQRFVAMLSSTKLLCEFEEKTAIVNKWQHFEEEDDCTGSIGSLSDSLGNLSSQELQLLEGWSECTDEHIIHRKQTRRCAWIVFRVLTTVGICGIYERREAEAKLAAAMAKLKRKQRSQKLVTDSPRVLSPVNSRSSIRSGSDPARAAGMSYEEEDIQMRTAEAASDAAKLAATNRDLEEPVLQTLWFSIEFHRKVFEVIEKELLLGTALAQDTEGLTRAQRMLRSISTPLKRPGGTMRTHTTFVDSDKAKFGLFRPPMSTSKEALEPLEIEIYMFGLLTFMLSQSNSYPALGHLSKPRVLRELLQLLRLGSPRSQRLVKLLLRSVCRNGIVKPADVKDLLGSESIFIDLLLDQVAESVCSTAAPLPTHAVSVPANVVGQGASAARTVSESLSNPIGFRSGQIYLALASESVALLRLLLRDQHWQARVSELLCVAIRSIAPMMKRSNGSEDGRDKGVEMSDIRMRAAIIRAVGALCVLGSHTDCMRIGGRVEVTAKESTSSGSVDYGFNFSDRGVGPTLATLIELNSKASTARVVFEDTSEDSEPGHNVQEVNLSSVSPVEEIHLSSSTIPLTIDMMPVILQLSSLEESEVMSSFDDLWRLQIRSRALLAFEAIMRHSISMAKDIIRQAMSRNLLSTALTPIGLNTFVSLPFLQERGRMILCRLIESSTPLGPAMFYGLKDPKLPVPEVDDNNDDDSHSADMHNNPGEEETEEYRVRRGFASTLAAMGFEFDLCMAALEQSRNDPNLAVEWLMGGGAAAYQERQRAHRLTAYHIAQKAKDSSSAESELSIEVKARELESISGMPYCLAFCALELSNGDPNRAMEWLMEHGTKYTDKHENMVALSDAFRAKRSHALSDAAALEDVDQPDSLVANPRIESQVTSSNKNTDSSNIMAVTLAPILAPAPTRPSKGGSVAQIPGFAPLDPNYLTPHVLLTVSNDVGPVQRLSASGRTGIFRRSSSEDGILVTFLNTETGAYEDEWHSPKDVRRLVKIYDEPMKDVSSIHKIALRTENALSTHYARRVVTAILNAWDAAHDTDAEAGRSISIMNAMGGPRQFVNFVKLIAASDMAFSREPDGKPGGGLRKHRSKASRHLNDSPKTTLEELPSLLETVQTLVLEILDEEADSGRLRDADWLWRRAGEQSPRLTSKPNNADTMSTLVDTSAIEDEDDEEALCQAIALSIREAAVAANTESVSVALRDEEQKDSEDAEFEKLLHSQNPRALRVRQPSYNEAQDVARAYLGGSVDDHDGLLSSVLVKECVSHFVESTRVAGEGVSCDSHEPMEFQSLHPYFGRCDYTRAVSASTSSRCLRIVFDERCKLGPKAKLSLYSDAECTDRIALIEAANTADDKPLADIIVHGHEFWFRFVATEDDPGKNHGYGFRFQVRPMSSISWSNEKDVLTNPSLEWACWVLGFLLNDAGELVSRGAVHNRKIYGALVRYLRSPGAPFKTRVVRLLLQLLHRPELFPRSEIPDLEPLEAMGQLALVRARNDKESGKVFLSAHLLQLVELSIVTKAAAKVFAGPVPTLLQPKWPLSPPPLPERKGVTENLEDVAAILGFLLGERQTLPNDVLVAIWLDACGASAVIESNHPYTSDVLLHGVLEFPGAQSLLVSFDKRCATAEGVQLELVGTGSTHVATGTASSSVRTVKTFGGSKWPAGAIDIPGQSLEYTFMGEANPETHYGITVSITAEGIPRDKQLARAKQTDYHAFLMKLQSFQQATTERRWTPMMDAQLVDWVNINVESGGSGSTSSVDMKPSDVRFHPQLDALRCSTLLDVPLADVQLRFALLKHLNQNIKECISLLDLRDVHSTWTLAYKLRQLSHCIFFDIKNTLVESAIEATTVASDANGNSNNAARITLDRLQALESRDDREVEPSISECFFAQAFRQLNTVDPSLFRRKIDSKGRLFSVKFRGEEGVDWGGVYREGANSMVDDLFSQHFSLFVLCPNGQHDTGINRGMYLPNPKCTSPVAIQMFEFVGKLLGISLRTHGDFPFSFPSLVWKQLINQPLDRSDLEGTDAMFVQMLDGIQNCERDGIFTEEEFVAAFEGLDLRFTAFDCTGREVELVEGGRTKRVTFANRLEYCSLAERYRLYEGAAQVAAMVRGFATVSAVRVLTLLTWQEMEMLTCGSPKIDINHWKQHTRYDGYTENDETVKLFWEAMASFTDEQRSDFVRFAWGRSRLPRGKWPQPFKLTKKGGRDSTMGLPVAHTCFFSVELPPYTTIDKMRNMLLATINFGLGGILMA